MTFVRPKMRPLVLPIVAETDGTSASGTCALRCEKFYASLTGASAYIRLVKGLIAKVYAKEVSGEGETLFSLEYTHDVTAGTPAWNVAQSVKLPSPGFYALEKREPLLVLMGRTGKEAFRVTWQQTQAAKAYLLLEVVIEEAEQ